MPNIAEQSEISRWVAARAGKYADVVIAGRVFGGRYGESPQCIRSARFAGTSLRIEFDPSEILTILEGEDFHLDPSTLIVRKVKGIVFGWHYYGRPRTQENWCELRHSFFSDKISISAIGPTPNSTEFFTVEGDAPLRLEISTFRTS